MTAAAVQPKVQDNSNALDQSTRETVESVVVAFILAFLFRAFVAEAFVIPTGSMAPTLMGAHKDLFCQHCGQNYQANASSEFDSSTGGITQQKTVASKCSNCRGINAYDFRGDKNHASFSGDRILVSKFDYVLSSPKRWDVIVFKFPLKARMNYIKRLIGLPGEQILITEGDVYTRTEEKASWGIARKPPHKIRAMRQLVTDTAHPPGQLIRQGWPSLWQPLPTSGENSTPAGPWTVEHTESAWAASLDENRNAAWLRYYHKVVDAPTWEHVMQGGTLPSVDPHASQLITDYLAYNTSYNLPNASPAFELKVGGFRQYLPKFLNRKNAGLQWNLSDEIPEETLALDFATERGLRMMHDPDSSDGLHWVGDLASTFELQIQSDSGTLLLDLVEFGIHFQCSVDVASGKATLQAIDSGQPIALWSGAESLSASTPIRGAGKYTVDFANFDDQIVLWINNRLVQFDGSTEFDSQDFRNGVQRRPFWTAKDPLDAAPLGIGGTNVKMRVDRAQVFRDIYYIAVQGRNFSDYPSNSFQSLSQTVPDVAVRANLRSSEEIFAAVYSHPEWWDRTSLFQQRGVREFELQEKQYFPMGDNSASSSDARVWYGHTFVEERYLLGKALLVFWPHTWNSPVPFTPNVSRMGMIR